MPFTNLIVSARVPLAVLTRRDVDVERILVIGNAPDLFAEPDVQKVSLRFTPATRMSK